MSRYEGHKVQDHQGYLVEELLPNLVDYAGRSNAPAEVVVMAAFLSLATILQSKGLCRETLMKAIDAAALQAGESEWGAH
ncbi:hypothetical protein [Pseudomonas sp. PS02290]|uniref:hypothetical protein n=1 Tax=Pseudomonas sp. PS02290 TaxID=2991430 RepID=UPI002499DB37|nr:hypothetical protein [Pseudomonas sp. PS02290]